jgi:hypothetical protein
VTYVYAISLPSHTVHSKRLPYAIYWIGLSIYCSKGAESDMEFAGTGSLGSRRARTWAAPLQTLGSCMARWEWVVMESLSDSQSTVPSARRSVTRGFSTASIASLYLKSALHERQKREGGRRGRICRTLSAHYRQIPCAASGFLCGRAGKGGGFLWLAYRADG